ncbi:inhibitor of host transcription [Escherichia phage EcS1]|uniref:Inhibitor of host transcription n=1 Tax=Escherichia phage EcS1 TaxID=2083276 RepID=A0A2Z5ZDC4_9CAUD|nr:inhibitor of host transcription [Escherichia phage EcS1]BBC78293.1 Inhibitor of host transcription [Escherichia phage EcS1]
MNMQLITNEMVMAQYGDRHDGISIFKGSKTIGYITDLRIAMARNLSKRKKQKEYNNKVTEARRDAMPDAVEEMKSFLENQLGKYGAEVFINISQPNVHLSGNKCYIIVDPIYGNHRLGIQHSRLTADEMASMVETCFKISASDSPHHILINNMTQDDIFETIVKLCLL